MIKALMHNIFLNAIHFGLAIGTFLLLTHVLSPVERGDLAGLVASVSLLTSVSSLGIPFAFSQFKGDYVPFSYVVRLLIVSCFVALSVSLVTLARIDTPHIGALIFITSLTSLIVDTRNRFENYRQKYLKSMTTNYVYNASIFLFLAFCLFNNLKDISWAYGAYAFSGVIVLIFAIFEFIFHRVRRDAPNPNMKVFVRSSNMFWALGIVSTLSKLFYYMFFISDISVSDIGTFVTFVGLFSPLGILTSAVGRVLYGGELSLSSSKRVLMLFGILISISIAFIALVTAASPILFQMICHILPTAYCNASSSVPVAAIYVMGTTLAALAIEIAARFAVLGRFIVYSAANALVFAGAFLFVSRVSDGSLLAFAFGATQFLLLALSLPRTPKSK